ncbi:MAG: MerR family transcriptional regulator [Acidobacteriota bacterium]
MFKIGDFSKIAQTPVSQLRYYADIGLLEPAEVDPFTGYRYYRASQLPRLNRILVLKELGFSLDQIRRALADDIAADEVRGMMRMRKAEIERSLDAEVQRLRMIEVRLQQIEHEDDDVDDAVVLKAVPAQRFIGLRETFAQLTDTLPVVQEMLRVLPGRLGPRLGAMTAMLHGSFTLENADIEFGFTVLADADDAATRIALPSARQLTMRELPAVETMATVARVGSFENNCRSYGALGRWVERSDYAIDGVAREVFVQPPRPGCEDETVVEIQVPVRRARSPALPA